MTPPAGADRWNDLRTRVISAAVMLAVGAAEVWLGGVPFLLLVVALIGLMIWELATITAPTAAQTAIIAALVATASLTATLLIHWPFASIFMAVPLVVLAVTPRRDSTIVMIYAAAILLAGYGLVTLRQGAGTPAILWLIGVVIASDVLGYFAGRIFGGPKFWPAISPKKTWSGTVAGWFGAALVGLGFVLWGGAGWTLVILSPLVALAGQMGDIVESWIKRRAGVKDSSHLIPGHGGLLDRFDALIGAVVAVLLLGLVLPLPLIAGN
jgi:phosphatidate cytidylyltransferase